MQDNRQLALEISRIKAPKRRKTPASKVALSSSSDARPQAASAAPLSIDRFLPLDRKDLPRGPIRIKPIMATPKPGFDPVMTFRQQRCSCHHISNVQGNHECSHTSPRVVSVSHLSTSSASSIASGSTVSETYNWLINAGVPCSAFDPSPVDNSQDLFECEDELSSLFSEAPDKVPSHSQTTALHLPLDSPVAAPLNYGFNEVDATLDIPQDMLSDLNSTIWDL